jgi:16S rRNA (guanine1516-N2)-methyltransferase
MKGPVVVNPGKSRRLSAIASRLNWPEVSEPGEKYELAIELVEDQLSLTEIRDGRPIRHQVDIDTFLASQRSFPASRKGVFNQAIGRRSVSVIDATGGWGGDSLLLCSQGYRVTTIERTPLLAMLLEDAYAYLAESDWKKRNNVHVPALINSDAAGYLAAHAHGVDCIYLDPMFPVKRKTSAAVNKTIRLLQDICGPDEDAAALLEAALQTEVRRVVVKRPHFAGPLAGTPTQSFRGKLVRYDLYLR